jgi:hypothetical protein
VGGFLFKFRLPDPQGTVNGTSDQAKDHFRPDFRVTARLNTPGFSM